MDLQDTFEKLETDPRLPSGPWTGFFRQWWMPGRHAMTLNLTFKGGSVQGTGQDRVGNFTIAGEYDLALGKCHWSKKYLGRHSVFYQGLSEGEGIWGMWELPQLWGLFKDRGGFHIWPGVSVVHEGDRTLATDFPDLVGKALGHAPSSKWRQFAACLLLAGIIVVWRLLLNSWMP